MPKSSKAAATARMKTLNKSKYRYYNANPSSRFTDDCVIRAIATGENRPWEEICVQLNELALHLKLVLGDERVYGRYLAEHGWEKQKQPKKPDGKKYTINEFLDGFFESAIIHAGNCHMSYVTEGHVYDIFNCEDRIIGCYWVKTPQAKASCNPNYR